MCRCTNKRAPTLLLLPISGGLNHLIFMELHICGWEYCEMVGVRVGGLRDGRCSGGSTARWSVFGWEYCEMVGARVGVLRDGRCSGGSTARWSVFGWEYCEMVKSLAAA